VPIGLEAEHVGVIDLIDMKAHYFDGPNGEIRRIEDIPAELVDRCDEQREIMLDAVSMFSDELMEAMLEDEVTSDVIRTAVRRATIGLQMTPVFCGSAYKNKGVQTLMDAVVDFLPDPTEVSNKALPITGRGANAEQGEPEVIPNDPNGPTIVLAFKLEDGRYGQLTYLRVYSGTLRRDDYIYNMRSGKKLKVGRLVRMHSDEMEDIKEGEAGDIIAIFGVDCHSGDTFTDGSVHFAMTSMHVAKPVISIAVTPVDNKSQQNMSKALQRFTKEDPTFRVAVDSESGETVIEGMGELHLDVYVERMKREYDAIVITSPPKVAYRETLTRTASFNYTHRKQTGGSGQYGRVVGKLIPHPDSDFEFESKIRGGNIPKEYISAVRKGFQSMLAKGRLIGAPVVNVKVLLTDGASHSVDSSDVAFQEAARGAWRATYTAARPAILEPLMKVELEGPVEFHGSIVATLMQRRGQVVGAHEEDGFSRIEAHVPLAEMFGYATTLRSATQGKANFTMEFDRYVQVPRSIHEALLEAAEKAKSSKGKK
jgi:elongation factor G